MRNFYNYLLTAGCLAAAVNAFALGAKKPAEPTFPPITDANYHKYIIAINDFKGRQVFANPNDGVNFENTLFQQYLDLLLQSGRYTIRVDGSKGPAVLEHAKDGGLQFHYDSTLAQIQSTLPCRFYDEQFLFDGNVTSFEVTSDNGFSAGLAPSLALYGFGAGLSFDAKSAKMSMSLEVTDAYNEVAIASTETDANQSTHTFNFNISYQQLANIGYNYYSTTPLADVSKSAITLGINNLVPLLKDQPWQGRVLSTDGKELILLNAGTDAGFKVGDDIEVMDFTPQEDPACRTMPIDTKYGKPGSPLGHFRIYDVELTHSWAQLVARESTGPLMEGSKVRIWHAPVVTPPPAPPPTAPPAAQSTQKPKPKPALHSPKDS